MKVPSKILGPDGRPLMKDVPARRIRSTYDAAGQGADNRKHWANADLMSPRTSTPLGVRQRLRSRARYEFANNSYCNGLIVTLANDMIGTGPTLQSCLSTADGEADDEANDQIEVAFTEWAEASGLVEKLQTAKQAKTRDGEAFFILATNPKIDNPVQLALRQLECDQVSTPQGVDRGILGLVAWTDGIEMDEWDNPTFYHVLHEHPGDAFIYDVQFTRTPADRVIHWFRRDRPGQVRGVPEITPSLNLFAQKRRYTLATLLAAETAAEFAAVLKSNAPPEGPTENTDEDGAFSEFEISRNMLTQLPEGWEIQQFKPQQPVNTYEMFKRELLKEIGRCVNAPFNVIAGDSSLYNYSSARLDHLLYRGALLVERDHCRKIVLERIFSAWLEEARLIPGLLPAGLPERIPHTWYWPGFATIDPLKEALADEKNLANGTTTLKELMAEGNRDWEEFIEQRGREVQKCRELGLPVPGEKAADPNAQPPGAPASDPTQEDDPAQMRAAYVRQVLRNGMNGGRH